MAPVAPIHTSGNGYVVLHIEAHIRPGDLKPDQDVILKFTTATSEILVNHHLSLCSIYCGIDEESNIAQQVPNLHREFISGVDRFTYTMPAHVLKETMDDDGTGELPQGPREEVYNMVVQLYEPLVCLSRL